MSPYIEPEPDLMLSYITMTLMQAVEFLLTTCEINGAGIGQLVSRPWKEVSLQM